MKAKTVISQLVVSIMILTVAATIATGASAKDTASPLSVYVVNYPLQYFAQRIGGPEVRVSFPAPEDGDPAFWKPGAEQIVAYQNADLILLNGASYAKWVHHVSLPASRLVDTSISFADQFITIKDTITHSHGLEGKHAHGNVAFTTWLDPAQAIVQAKAVRDALVRRRPGATADFNQRFDALAAELHDLDGQLTAVFTTDFPHPLVFSHPVYQYFIRRYGVKGQEVHWEPDESPTLEQWAELKRIIAKHPAEWMIWEGTPQQSTAHALKKMGLGSLTFNPCGNVPETGDYLSVMRENVVNLQRAFGQ